MAKQGKKSREKGNYKLFIKLFVIIAIIAILAITFFVFRPFGKTKVIDTFSYNNFNYIVEDWGKTKDGKHMIFYHTEFLLPKYNTTYRLYLRNDPRNNTAELNLENLKEIKATTYIAIDKNFDNKSCTELPIAPLTITSFIGALNVHGEVAIFSEGYTKPSIDNFVAIGDYNFAKKNNVTVIVLKYGNESRVYNANDTIVVQSQDCSIILPTEKLLLFIADRLYKNNAVIPKDIKTFTKS